MTGHARGAGAGGAGRCCRWARGVPEGSPTYAAVEDESAGHCASCLGVARRATDGDGDGFSRPLRRRRLRRRREPTAIPGAEDDPRRRGRSELRGRRRHRAAAAAGAGGRARRRGRPAPPVRRAGDAFARQHPDRQHRCPAGRPPGRGRLQAPQGPARSPRTWTRWPSAGAYFRRAWSQAPNTPRSFPSFLTGRYPSEVAWAQRSLNYSPILPRPTRPSSSSWRGAGCKPIGIFSHFYFSADRGLNQGFAEWNNDGAGTIAESNKDIASPRIVPRVIARLQQAAAAKERFVLWTHLFEPHSSYMAHKEFPTTLTGVEGLEEKYDYEIAFVDRWVGKILAGAGAEPGSRDNTAVVVFADHGEAWGEHKLYFHGQDLSEEQLRVPLILAVPGTKPVVVDDPRPLVDVGRHPARPGGADPAGELPRAQPAAGASTASRCRPRPLFGELLPATAWPKHEVMMVDRAKS